MTTVDGNAAGPVITIDAAATVTVRGLSLRNGRGAGAGVRNEGTFTLQNSTVAGNISDSGLGGGGLYQTLGSGPMLIQGCTISGNTCAYVAPNSNYYPQGSALLAVGGGPVTILESTIEGNFAGENAIVSRVTPLIIDRTAILNNTVNSGLAIEILGSELTLTNSTIAQNGAGVDGFAARGTIDSCTIYGNSSTGVHWSGLDAVLIRGSVIGVTPGYTGCSILGQVISGGYNRISVPCPRVGLPGFLNGVNGDQVGTNASPISAGLGPLADNGGPTLTLAPLVSGPLIDAGHPALGTRVDQCGAGRAAGSIDIGAVDLDSIGKTIPDCLGVANSTGAFGGANAVGSDVVQDDDVTLCAFLLPAHQFGIFLAASSPDLATVPGSAAAGFICLGAPIGRFIGPGQILSTGAAGEFSLPLNLNLIPTGGSPASVASGETWFFQAWHRDTNAAGASLTSGVQILFR